MAQKYHVNNENEAHPCRVTVQKCEFEDSPHFETKAAASKYAEAKNEQEYQDKKFAVISKSEAELIEAENDSVDDRDPHSYDVLESGMVKVKKSIEKVNRRLEKAGIEDRFELEEKSRYQKVNSHKGQYFTEDRVKFTLNYPRISYNGYEFQARVEKTESGKFVAYSSPGVELSGWRPTSMECEHCHKNIPRSKVYAVKDADGNMKTVGGKCVELYTGLKPTNLWAMEYKVDKDLDEDDYKTGGGAGTRVEKTDDLISIAYVLTKDSGYQNSYSEKPTSQSVSDVLYPERGIKPTPEEIEWANQKMEEAKDVDVAQIRKEVKEALKDSNNDWANNLKVLIDEEYVNSRGRGTVISAMAALHKQRAKKAQKPWAKGFLGEPKEKIAGVKAKVIKAEKDQETYGYNTSYVTKITMQTEDGHKVFWKTSSEDVPEKGETIVFNATIKDNTTFRDIDTTRVLRAKWSAVGEDDAIK